MMIAETLETIRWEADGTGYERAFVQLRDGLLRLTVTKPDEFGLFGWIVSVPRWREVDWGKSTMPQVCRENALQAAKKWLEQNK